MSPSPHYIEYEHEHGASGVARYLCCTTELVGVYRIRWEFYGDAWLDPGYGEGNLTIY